MTYEEILTLSATLLNDTERAVYTNTVMLPFLNIARMELEEIFELNSIPVTNETSAVITVPIGVTKVGFATTPALPANLVEIQQLFESTFGQNTFIPMTKREYLTPYELGNAQISFFRVWSWMNQEIRIFPAIVKIDLKIDYIRYLFYFLILADLTDTNITKNTSSFLQYRVASLCAEFIMHDSPRADALNRNAGSALERSLGISVKGMQGITTRRRPFRAGFKNRRRVY